MSTFIATRSTALVITIDEVRAQLQLHGDTSYDVELNLMMQAAQQYVEDQIGEFLGSTTVIQPFEGFRNVMPLDQRYIASVQSVTYLNETGTTLPVLPAVYTFDNSGIDKSIRLNVGQSWPTGVSENHQFPVRVNYTAQLTPTPLPLIHAMLMVVSDLFNHRGATDMRTYEAPVAVKDLLFRYVRRGF